MKNTNISATLKELITAKGGPCASLIVPVHELPSEKPLDNIAIDHALEKLKAQLNEKDEVQSGILTKVKMLAEQARNIQGENGIGIFASPALARLCTFPFEVQEKVHVNSSFEIRELVQKERYTREYFVLLLGGYSTRLFRGKENKLREYNDNNFPAWSDGREYEVPAIPNQGNNALSATKRDKATTTLSLTEFYNIVDAKLRDYITDASLLILAGPEKEAASFLNHSIHASKIKGKVLGAYSDFNMEELEKKCWDAVKLDLKKGEKELLERLREQAPAFISAGIVDVWRDARQGKGNVLMIEKGLEVPAYLGMDDYTIELNPSRHDQPIVVDAVDDIVETVIEKNGSVVFVENGLLKDYQRIAMMNRY
jgi:hypothetical protein